MTTTRKSAPVAPKRLRAPERRRRLLAAALSAFARKGYDGASMEAIAAAAGVTKPVLYDHFRSKPALFTAVLEQIRGELLAAGAAAARRPVAPEQRFRAGVAAFFQFAANRPQALQVLLFVPQRNPKAATLARQVQRGATAGIAALLGTVWQPAEVWRLEAAAEFIKSGMHALASWKTDHSEVSGEQLTELVMQTVWRGLRHHH